MSRALAACATTSPSFQQKLKGLGARCDWVVPTAVPPVFAPDVAPAEDLAELRRALSFGHPERLLAVFVGRLAPEKDLPELVKAVQLVPHAQLVIVGDGPLRHELAALHGEAQRVHCVPGFKDHPEIAKVYACADVHASMSVFETLGNTVLEAHACGTPVVVPNAQGFCDTVTHGVDGFLVEPTAASFAAALQQLADDPAKARAMGANGRAKVLATRSDAAVARSLMSWYERTLAQWRAAPPRLQVRRAFQRELVQPRRGGKGDRALLAAGSVATSRLAKTVLVWLLACAVIVMVQAYDDSLIVLKQFVKCKHALVLQLVYGREKLKALQHVDCAGPKRALQALKAVDCAGPKRELTQMRQQMHSHKLKRTHGA